MFVCHMVETREAHARESPAMAMVPWVKVHVDFAGWSGNEVAARFVLLLS